MRTLHAGTYLSPSIPVEYFEMILQYLESKLGIHTTLLYESRWEGPRAERQDPFLSGYLDIGRMLWNFFILIFNFEIKFLKLEEDSNFNFKILYYSALNLLK